MWRLIHTSGRGTQSATVRLWVLALLTGSMLVASGCSGASKSGSTQPPPPAAVTVALSASPSQVQSGAAATLSWNSTNATSCSASGGWTGTKTTSGTESTGALTAATDYTLMCSGATGSASASISVTVAAAVATNFPLHVVPGKRYLVDSNGKPFLIQGDAAWSLIAQLTRAQVDQYLDDRRLKGFNTILVNLIEHKYATNPPNDVYGDAPFLVPGDFSTPNEAYFAHADYVISKAEEKGILVLLAPAYMGYQGGDQGWYQEMVANGETTLRGYGQYVANRLSGHNNILWVDGGDYNPPEKTLLRAVANGIGDVSQSPLQTFHGARGTSALAFLGLSEPWLTVNDIYTDETSVVANAFTEYQRSTMPYFLIEARYENEGGANEAVVRAQAYQAVLSGADGQVMGNNPVWGFTAGWQTALSSPGAQTLTFLHDLMESRDWWSLVPDVGGTFLTGGTGSGETRAVAAKASDGSFAIIYAPTGRTLTVDLTQMMGPEIRAQWYDPTSGSYLVVPGSPFQRSSSQTFVPGGLNGRGFSDWALVLDSVQGPP